MGELGKLPYNENELDLSFPEDAVIFPAVKPLEVMGIEYEMLSMSLRNHLMSIYHASLLKQDILDSTVMTNQTRT